MCCISEVWLKSLYTTEQTGKFLTDAENCLLKVQDLGDIQVTVPGGRSSNSKRTRSIGETEVEQLVGYSVNYALVCGQFCSEQCVLNR